MGGGSGPAAGGGRWVDVPPERVEQWLDGFARRHGPLVRDGLRCTAADGAVADLVPPLRPVDESLDPELRVGVLLVRLGGHAAGVFEGGVLVASKVGSRPVHGRSAAGGQSQQRFARRRDGQARVALQAAADVAARVLLGAGLDAVVTGGARAAVDEVLADPRLAPLAPLVVERRLDVPDPRQRVLEDTPRLWRSVRVRVLDPPVGDPLRT